MAIQDPLDAAMDTGDQELLFIFTELARMIRYFDFSEVSIETFKLIRNLALLDTFSTADDQEIGRRLNYEPEILGGIRSSPEYAEMCHSVRTKFEQLADPLTIREHVQDVALQDRIFRETVRVGLYSTDPRVKEKSLAQVNDRTMPRVTREVQQRVLMIQAKDLHLIEETERQLEAKMKALPAGSESAE